MSTHYLDIVAKLHHAPTSLPHYDINWLPGTRQGRERPLLLPIEKLDMEPCPLLLVLLLDVPVWGGGGGGGGAYKAMIGKEMSNDC